MRKAIDLSGQRFGMLTVVERVESKIYSSGQKQSQFLCKCDCGKEKVILYNQLVRGKATSCGCFRAIAAKKQFTTHGLSYTRLNRIWSGIKGRCFNNNSTVYKHYGGRGITVCDEWKDSFEAFYEWALKNGYSDDLSIDRIDNDGNYEPSNCRWVEDKQQCNNRRSNHLIEYNGETHTLQEWSEISGVSHSALIKRIKKGNTIDMVLKEVK